MQLSKRKKKTVLIYTRMLNLRHEYNFAFYKKKKKYNFAIHGIGKYVKTGNGFQELVYIKMVTLQLALAYNCFWYACSKFLKIVRNEGE